MINWISVKDELPKDGEVVLVKNDVIEDDFKYLICWYDKKNRYFRSWTDECGDSIRDYDSFYTSITEWAYIEESEKKENVFQKVFRITNELKSLSEDWQRLIIKEFKN